MLEQFPSLKIPIEDIIQILPKLQPRYYSISSSTRYNPNQLHITVSIVTYRTIRDIIRNGICSNFLKQTKPLLKDDEKMIDSLTLSKENASKVQLFIVPNLHFRLPGQENLLKEINNDKELFLPLNRPLLMFAIGSGIAPFRSFWQELQILHNLNSNNNIVIDRVLFFGCRTKNDFLFAKELQLLNYEKNSSNKLLTFIIPVYSREKSAAKRYVQDAMLDYQQLISSIIKNENSFIYMCGSTRACQSIESTLASILEISNNDTLTSDQANYQIQQFKQSGKIKQDMFG
ncbi:unnamed protein product [Adineta steineri]|uniref:FAD-binding FR-type domain-containing protein n=1 Tax=Adineta steineri TaxID=433720 RepID=A0A815CBS8_9BILA|nr:unnamed protein product [Adineta steineri]CAF1566540.1 unnamed protein product [Adineta steineri]